MGVAGSTNNPYNYVGKYGVATEPNGFMFMRTRFYDSQTRNFLGRDPINGTIENGQTLGLYSYVQGNPLSYIDASGKIAGLAYAAGAYEEDPSFVNTLSVVFELSVVALTGSAASLAAGVGAVATGGYQILDGYYNGYAYQMGFGGEEFEEQSFFNGWYEPGYWYGSWTASWHQELINLLRETGSPYYHYRTGWQHGKNNELDAPPFFVRGKI